MIEATRRTIRGGRQRLGVLVGGLIRTMLRGFSYAIGGTLTVGVIGIVNQSLILRQLTPDQYGEYSLLLTNLMFLASLIGFGFDTWVLRDGGAAPELLADSVWQVLLIKMIVTLLMLAALSIGWAGNIQYSVPFLLGIIMIACSAFNQTAYAALRARARNGLVAIFQITEAALLLGALLLPQQMPLSVTLLMAMRLGITLIAFSVLIWQLIAICGSIQPHLNIWRAVRGTWLYLMADLFATVYSQLPTIVLGGTAGVLAVGLFRPALDLITLVYIVPQLIYQVALPLLAAPSITRRDFMRSILVIAAGGLLFGIAALVGVLLFGGAILQRLTDHSYTETYQYLLLLSPLPLLKTCSFIAALVLLARNRVHLRVIAQAITSAICAAVCYTAIPALGATGAAAAVLATEVCLLTLYTIAALHAYRNSAFAQLYRPSAPERQD